MSNWSKWKDISSIDNLAGQLSKIPGVYKMRLSNSAGRAHPIGRLLDADKKGVLAIGESVNLARRIKEFHRAYIGDRFMRHSVGDRLFLVLMCQYSRFKTAYQNNVKIQFAVMKLNNKTEAETKEERLLKGYFKKFGELPPLNSLMPDKYISWDEIIKM
jgi:predicted GIY-YIG superfamily endonuclease